MRKELASMALVLAVVIGSAVMVLRPVSASPQISLEGTAVDYVSGTFLDVTPNSLSVGDLMILQVSTNGDRSITVPSGWQLRGIAGQTQELRQWLYTKVATSADIGQSILVTTDAASSWGLNALLAYYSGVDTANPIRNFSARLWNEASVMDIDYTNPPDYTDGIEDVVFVAAVIEEPSTLASALGVLNRRFAITTMPGTATILDNANNFSNQGPFTITSPASPGVRGNLTMLGLNPIGAPAPTYSLSGSVFIDKTGDGVGAGGIGGASDPYVTAIPNVDVWLDDGDGTLDSGDTLLAAMTPTVGTFSVPGLADGDYFVVVDGLSVSATAGTLAEQTWGPAGALCDDGTGVTYVRAIAGSCYGGADANASDDPSSFAGREHVAMVTISGASVTELDFGFSHRVVTNTRPTGSDDYGTSSLLAQGTIEQFVQNANLLAGADTMRFVPVVPPNDVDASGIGFWRIAGATDLVINDAFTSLRGNRTTTQMA